MNSMDEQYDVVIVGAGMSGSLLALSLLTKNTKLKVLLLDENSPRTPVASTLNPSFDARCIALNAGSVAFLQDLSLWDEIKPNAQPIQQIQVSDKGYLGSPTLAPENKNEAFGYVVELRHVGQVLAQALATFTSLTTLFDAKLLQLQQYQTGVTCTLTQDKIIHAKLCVGADGGNSQVRALARISYQKNDYGRSAIICNIRCHQPHQNIAYERFTKNGPIALLPLTEHRFSVVYCVDNKALPDIETLSDADFLTHLQAEFGYRAGVFQQTGSRDVYPLTLLTTDHPIAHRVVCIGNAAHSLHPVAGQGFNLGLRDLHVLADIITQTPVQDIGSFSMLSEYWQCRQRDHNTTILMTDSLVRIFSNQHPLLSVPRNIGLQAMSLLPFLSTPLIEQAKGEFDLFNRENLS